MLVETSIGTTGRDPFQCRIFVEADPASWVQIVMAIAGRSTRAPGRIVSVGVASTAVSALVRYATRKLSSLEFTAARTVVSKDKKIAVLVASQ